MRVLAGLLGCLVAATARADADDALNFSFGATLRYDTNLFLLPSYVDPQVVLGKPRKSDWVSTAYAGVAIDKPYGLQRFQLEAKITAYRYQTFDFLDFNGKNYRAAWLWSLTPDLTGTLLAAQTEAPVSYADFRGRSLNIQTSQIQRAHADYRVSGGWHVTGAFDHTTFKNSAVFTQVGNTEMDTVEAGVKYIAASGSMLGIVQREGSATYVGQIISPITQLPGSYDQSETLLRGRWEVSGRSSLGGYVGWLSRSNDPFPDRDFSGVIGQIDHLWTPTGKLTVNTAIGRNLYPFLQNTSSYFSTNYVTIAPAWAITAKTTARLTASYDIRDYEGAIVPVPFLRRDKTATGELGLEWAAMRTLTLTTYVRHGQRISNYPNFNYVDTVAGVTAGLKF